MAEDEMVRQHHQLNGQEFEKTPGDSGGQRSLVCCSSWGCKELNMTQQLDDNNQSFFFFFLTDVFAVLCSISANTAMWDLKKKMVQMNLFTKQKQSHRCRKSYSYQEGRWGEG